MDGGDSPERLPIGWTKQVAVKDGEQLKKNYDVLKESDIGKREEDDITTVSGVLSISKVAASILLQNYSWNVSNVHEAWFADEERVRKAVGLLEQPIVQYPNAKADLLRKLYP